MPLDNLESEQITLVKSGYVKVDDTTLLANDWCQAASREEDRGIKPGSINEGPLCQSNLKDGNTLSVPFTPPEMANCSDDNSDLSVWTSWIAASNPSDYDSSLLQVFMSTDNQ